MLAACPMQIVDVLLGIFLRQKQHLGNHQVCNVVVNRGSDEDDIVPQQPGINVICPFPTPGLFYDHRYQHHLLLLVHLPHFHPKTPLVTSGEESKVVRYADW
jgi:hypothetical protein